MYFLEDLENNAVDIIKGAIAVKKRTQLVMSLLCWCRSQRSFRPWNWKLRIVKTSNSMIGTRWQRILPACIAESKLLCFWKTLLHLHWCQFSNNYWNSNSFGVITVLSLVSALCHFVIRIMGDYSKNWCLWQIGTNLNEAGSSTGCHKAVKIPMKVPM